MNKLRTLSQITIIAAGLLGLSSAIAGEKAIIVLDASGSMWGQIDGVAKIIIATDALSKVVNNTPKTTELGLMAYGHRKKGVCGDIELLVKPSAGSRSRILSSIRGIKPKGKTPLSASVLKAAESLKYTEEKATVILITDGLETCNADPCALGKNLKRVVWTSPPMWLGLILQKRKRQKYPASQQKLADNILMQPTQINWARP